MNLSFLPSSLLRSLRRGIGLLLIALGLPAFGAEAAPAPTDCPPLAQAPTPDQVSAAMKTARDRGFFWRIQKDGRTSYLYGTIHVGRFEWLFPGPTLVKAMQASDLVALELDMSDQKVTASLQSGMAKKATQAPLPAELENRLVNQLHLACLPTSLLQQMSPEMLAIALVASSARRDGLDPAYAIDPTFAGVAQALRKPIESLETTDLQLNLLRSGSPQETLDGLDKTLRELEQGKSRRSLLKVSQVWASGDFDQLADYAAWCDCQNSAAEKTEMKQLLDDRNPVMAQRIDVLHAEGKSVFAAVGALHMIGPLGLPKLMGERGYRVERVEFKP
jgi:uncharacterized protein YbaP (TraB family)